MDLLGQTSSDLHDTIQMLQSGEAKVSEVVAASLSALESLNPKLNAVVSSQVEQTRREAELLDRMPLCERTKFPLFGIPVTIKDNICTADLPTTCGSEVLKSFFSGYDAFAVRALRKAGAIIIGKTNCDEFAMGSSTENSCYGRTKNPWKITHVAGGTSGGSASAVAAGVGFFSLGSDTGGSVRQPAGFCGVVGLKPTYGSVSRFGLIAHGSSLDQIGIVGRRVRDCSKVFSIISGRDPCDLTSRDREISQDPQSLGALRVAAINLANFQCQPDVEQTYSDFMSFLENRGHRFEKIALSFLDIAVPLYYVISTAEAASNLSRYDGIRFGITTSAKSDSEIVAQYRTEKFGLECKRRILLGSFVLSEGYFDQYYAKAKKIRTWLMQEFRRLFDQHDIIVMPTSPTTAFEIGAKIEDPVQMYLSDVFTTIANLIGIPAISIPAGFDQNGLPIGMQMMAPWGKEGLLMAAAETFEKEHPWYERSRPKFH